MADTTFTPENVIAVGFADDSAAFEALTTLNELDSQGQVRVVEAAVVTRSDDGYVQVKDQVGDETLVGMASGGLIGLIVGILGGPLGVLIGGATGLLIGSLYDLDDADDTDSVLSEVSKTVQVGRNNPARRGRRTDSRGDRHGDVPHVGDGRQAIGGRRRERDRRGRGGPARGQEGGAQEAPRGAPQEAPRRGAGEDRGAQGQAPPRPQARDDGLVTHSNQ